VRWWFLGSSLLGCSARLSVTCIELTHGHVFRCEFRRQSLVSLSVCHVHRAYTWTCLQRYQHRTSINIFFMTQHFNRNAWHECMLCVKQMQPHSTCSAQLNATLNLSAAFRNERVAQLCEDAESAFHMRQKSTFIAYNMHFRLMLHAKQ
jgi:hypothetical protein